MSTERSKKTKPKSRTAKALWHIREAGRILRGKRELDESPTEPDPSPKPTEPRPIAQEPSPGLNGEAAAGPGFVHATPGQEPEDTAVSADFLTIDRLEIRGRLGTNDHRELKINAKPPIELSRREHALLLILAWLAKCGAATGKAPKHPLPAFLPVVSILAIILKFTAQGGLLAGRWPDPTEVDIFRTVSKLRRQLLDRGFNPKLIQRGQRLSGYRLSTPPGNIGLAGALEPGEEYWSELFHSVLDESRASRKR